MQFYSLSLSSRTVVRTLQTYVAPAVTNNIAAIGNSTSTQDSANDDGDSSALTPAVRRGPEGKDNDSFLHEDVDKDSGTYREYLYFFIGSGSVEYYGKPYSFLASRIHTYTVKK